MQIRNNNLKFETLRIDVLRVGIKFCICPFIPNKSFTFKMNPLPIFIRIFIIFLTGWVCLKILKSVRESTIRPSAEKTLAQYDLSGKKYILLCKIKNISLVLSIFNKRLFQAQVSRKFPKKNYRNFHPE